MIKRSFKKAISGTSPDDYFFVKCNGKIEKVIYSELLYIEAMANYIVLHTIHDKLIVYLTIKGIMEKLPAAEFLQVHKSYVVNVNQINAIEGNILHLGATKITMGLSFSNAVSAHILKDKFIKR
jgi:DNA-binding LytR/AlgR family response regulator